MKMRTVIEAARKTAPLLDGGLSDIRAKADMFRQLIADMSSVKSEQAKEAMTRECLRGLDSLSVAIVDTMSKWDEFYSSLSAYKYKFRRAGTHVEKDLPGQQILFEDDSEPISRQDATGIP